MTRLSLTSGMSVSLTRIPDSVRTWIVLSGHGALPRSTDKSTSRNRLGMCGSAARIFRSPFAAVRRGCRKGSIKMAPRRSVRYVVYTLCVESTIVDCATVFPRCASPEYQGRYLQRVFHPGGFLSHGKYMVRDMPLEHGMRGLTGSLLGLFSMTRKSTPILFGLIPTVS